MNAGTHGRLLRHVVERDLRLMLQDRILVLLLFVNFGIDLFVSGVSLAGMVRSFNYFLFIAPGANLTTAVVVAFQSGRDFWRERFLRDLFPYLLSLPFPRVTFVAARLLAGVLRSVALTVPGTLVIWYLNGAYSMATLAFAFAIMTGFAVGIVGLSIIVASATAKLEVFATLRSTVQLYFAFFSTVFYPLHVLPIWLRPVAEWNPASWAVAGFRNLGRADVGVLGVLAATGLLLAATGGAVYLRSTRM